MNTPPVESGKRAPAELTQVQGTVCIPIEEFYIDKEVVLLQDLPEADIHDLLGLSA